MRHIVKEFPGVRALDDVSFQVTRASIHSLCGENGAGKSTLMKVLSGVWPHGSYSGEVIYEGQECRFRNVRDSASVGIAIIHQELALIPELTIAENIFLGNEIKRGGVIDWLETRKRAALLMAEVGLDDDPNTPIKELGVGKQQLVEIAKALSKNVRLLILDEPTSALNEEESAHLLDLMRKQRERGISQIMISHKLGEIEAVSDQITVIRDGRTIETMDVKDGHVNEDRIISSMVGRALDNRFPPRTPQIGEVRFSVKDWWVRHPINTERYVCKGSSIEVRGGEVVGLAGLMGAGRTELARSIFGQSYGIFESGQVFLDGVEIKAKSVPAAINAGLAYLPEDRKVQGLNMLDNIKGQIISAKMKKACRSGFVIDWPSVMQVAEDYRRDLRIKTPSVDNLLSSLSGGNMQKVVLAKWMYTDPKVLILDEPTRGIDVGAKYEIYGLIAKLAERGMAVVVISSELPELLGITDRIYTVFEGEITGCTDTAQADQESLLRLMNPTWKKP
ncbi:MAG: sugar ABC transporter ATP-binding protein [Actinomycetaceae bacterium]|nr:sugar ABC transporter ATP-binding protein [Actinomycetaceae bacterium]